MTDPDNSDASADNFDWNTEIAEPSRTFVKLSRAHALNSETFSPFDEPNESKNSQYKDSEVAADESIADIADEFSENVIPDVTYDDSDENSDAEMSTGPHQFPDVNDVDNDDDNDIVSEVNDDSDFPNDVDDVNDVDYDVNDLQGFEEEAEDSVGCHDDGKFSFQAKKWLTLNNKAKQFVKSEKENSNMLINLYINLY